MPRMFMSLHISVKYCCRFIFWCTGSVSLTKRATQDLKEFKVPHQTCSKTYKDTLHYILFNMVEFQSFKNCGKTVSEKLLFLPHWEILCSPCSSLTAILCTPQKACLRCEWLTSPADGGRAVSLCCPRTVSGQTIPKPRHHLREFSPFAPSFVHFVPCLYILL